jgi:prepilin-type N-terminal cleavage/methylation domain-containing protein
MGRKTSHRSSRRRPQSGMSLLETMIALAILLVASVGLLSLGMAAVGTTENQGHLTARTAEYAQDKMEQLVSLAYGDAVTDTTQFPACSPATTPSCTTGTGLTIGGSSDPTAPVSTPGNGYVDYLDLSGNPIASTGNWYYIRVWQVSQFATNLKQITVTAKVRRQVGAPQGALPQSTLVSLKSSPF